MSSTLLCKSLTRIIIRKAITKEQLLLSPFLNNNNNNTPLYKSLSTLPSSAYSAVTYAKTVKLINGLHRLQQNAFISTNKKPDGSSLTADVTAAAETEAASTTSSAPTKKKTWTSYGFDFKDEETDRNTANGVFFFTVTIALCGLSFMIAYMPDIRFKDWGQREAYIELARREALGLPLVDPDLVPVDKFELPSEEELGDFDIII